MFGRRASAAQTFLFLMVVLFTASVRGDCVVQITSNFYSENDALWVYSFHVSNNTPGFCGGIDVFSSFDGSPFTFNAGCALCASLDTGQFQQYLRCIPAGNHTYQLHATCYEHVGSSCVPDTGDASTSFGVSHGAGITAELGPLRPYGSGSVYDLHAHVSWSDAQRSDNNVGWSFLPTRTWTGGGGSFQSHPDANRNYDDVIGPDSRAELVLVGDYVCDASAFTVVEIPGKDSECSSCKETRGSCVGAPVRVSNGSMHYDDVDAIPPFPGGLRRNFDSSDLADGYFGKGWTSLLDDVWLRTRTENNGSTTLVIGTADHRRFVFNGSGSAFTQLWPRGGAPGAVTFDGTYYKFRINGSNDQLWFNTSGRIQRTVNVATGRQLTIAYTGGVPSAVDDSWGNVALTLSVNATTHHIDSITVGSSTTWNYAYDSSGHLTGVTVNGEPWRSYSYSGDRLTNAYDAAGNLIESHAYDTSGRATSSVGGNSNDISGITYGGSGRVTGESVTAVTAAAGATTSYYTRYGGGKERTVEIAGSCSGCGVNDLVLGLDSDGRVIAEQDARGYVTLHTYDSLSREIVRSGPWKPSACDPETDSAHCRVTPDTILTTSLASVAATVTQTTTYGDGVWPDRPTQVDVVSLSGSTHLRSETFTYDSASGATLSHTVTGYTGLPSLGTNESHTTTTALYDGTEGAVFTPGGSFSSSWLTLAQPAGLPKSVDGQRTDVGDVTQMVYYPIDSSVAARDRGHLAAVKNALGHITQFDNYDDFGNATRVVDPNGVATETTYDVAGRLLTSTIKAVSGCDTSADPLCATDLTVTRAYTPATGPLTSVTDAVGNVTAYEYDSRGRLSATSRGPSASDLRERMEIGYDATTALKTEDRTYAKVSSAWVLKKSDAYAYDSFGRLTATTHPDSTTIGYTYDPNSNLKTTRDENHSSANTTYAYDSAGRLAAVTQTLNSGTITTAYGYDIQGNLVSVTDPNGNVTTYVYDDFGRLLSQASPVTGTTSYGYDAAGNLTSTTDANGATTTRTYDALNRLLDASSVCTGLDAEVVSWTYDDSTGDRFAIGRLATMDDPSGSTAYSYDRRGLLRQEDRMIGTWSSTTAYRYDATGNRTMLGDLQYTYDFAGRPLSVTRSAGCTGCSAIPIVTSASYLPYGPETDVSFGNGTQQSRTYDSRYRITENKLTGPGSTTIADHNYSTDNAGNITAIDDAMNATLNRSFGYDDLNRLTTANTGTGLWGTGTFSYDDMGNLLASTVGSWEQSFTYVGTTSRIATSTEQGNSSSVDYDAAGNELTASFSPRPGAWWSTSQTVRAYSCRNLLSSATSYSTAGECTFFSCPIAEIYHNYTYDGRGVRVHMTDSPTRDYIYTPELELHAIHDAYPDSLAEFVRFNGHPVGQLSSSTPNTALYTFTDHLGTPILQTDASANVTWRAEYEPYGRIYALTTGTDEASQPLRFQGQDLADQSATEEEEHYNIFRWYRAGWGRYTQADPIGLYNSLNLYSYAHQNSLRFTDPRGLLSDPGGLFKTCLQVLTEAASEGASRSLPRLPWLIFFDAKPTGNDSDMIPDPRQVPRCKSCGDKVPDDPGNDRDDRCDLQLSGEEWQCKSWWRPGSDERRACVASARVRYAECRTYGHSHSPLRPTPYDDDPAHNIHHVN